MLSRGLEATPCSGCRFLHRHVSLARRNPRRDSNELEIVNALRQSGFHIFRLSDAGLPDLLVVNHSGKQLFLEVKSSQSEKLTDKQVEFFQLVRDAYVVYTAVEALAICQVKLGGA